MVRPLTLYYTIFGRKGTPFVYLPLENNERSKSSIFSFFFFFLSSKHFAQLFFIFAVFRNLCQTFRILERLTRGTENENMLPPEAWLPRLQKGSESLSSSFVFISEPLKKTV